VTSQAAQLPRVGVIVLSQGTRPDTLDTALASILAQEGVVVDVLCVGNGWEPTGLRKNVRGLGLPENLGIPAGRNAGVPHTTGEYLFFLDDDERVPSSSFLADAIRLIARHDIGMVQPRIADPSGAPSPRRWIPRLRKGSAERSSNVFSVLEGAIVLPRETFEKAGGWAGEFFYAHEGIELAWRVWDQGKRVWYAGDLLAEHPAVAPTRHSEYYRLNARNRVWLARRNLPAVLIPVYVGTWTGVQILRSFRQPTVLRAWFAGWREGWRNEPGERRPIRWRTILRMTLAGRPPVI
jgi:GT2 family glycosyltransferase